MVAAASGKGNGMNTQFALTPERLRAGFTTLPAFPKAVQDVLDLLQKPELELVKLAHAIEADPALTMRVLRTANSPFYGSRAGIATVRNACRVLGVHALRNVAITLLALQQFPAEGGSGGLSRHDLWRHCTAVAAAARFLAQRLGHNSDMAFTAGLLHDIGRMALDACFPVVYMQVLARRDSEGTSLHEAELAVFGMDHAAVATELVRMWQLPEAIAAAVGAHHPERTGSCDSYGDVVHIADIVCKSLQLGSNDELALDTDMTLVLQRLGITRNELDAWIPEIEVQVQAALVELGSTLA